MGETMPGPTLDNRSELDLGRLSTRLEAAGWNAVLFGRELAAHLDYPPTNGVWTLTFDRSGRFRFVAMRQTAQPEHADMISEGRAYKILLERREIMTVTGRLETETDLEAVLQDLLRLATN